MASIRILVGSVYGGALLTARALKKALEQEGHQIIVLENPALEDITGNDDPVLICTSTTGQGEVPPNLLPFYLKLREELPQQPGRLLVSSCWVTALTEIRFAVPVSLWKRPFMRPRHGKSVTHSGSTHWKPQNRKWKQKHGFASG